MNYGKQPIRHLHIGLGRFHRAHQAMYQHKLLNRGAHGAIGALSMKSSDAVRALEKQDYSYHVAIVDRDEVCLEQVHAIQKGFFLPEDYPAVLNHMETIEVITLTVSEKGYCREIDGDGLDIQHPDIQYDLASWGDQSPPRSVPGLLFQLIERKKEPLTVISCDNLYGNSRMCQEMVKGFAAQLGIGSEKVDLCRFIDSMVDRIVPATSNGMRDMVKQKFSVEDPLLVVTEPFCQWVLEKRGSQPLSRDWPGIEWVDDVASYEKIKLHVLNGSHSLLAYLGSLMGYECVHEAIADPMVKRLVVRYISHEANQRIEKPPGFSLSGYQEQLLQRFSNSGLPHRLDQIAMDGSIKLTERILPVYRILESAKDSICELAISSWLAYVDLSLKHGKFKLSDPLFEKLSAGQSESRDQQMISWLNLIGCEPSRSLVATAVRLCEKSPQRVIEDIL